MKSSLLIQYKLKGLYIMNNYSYYASKLDNLEEMDKFPEMDELRKLTQE